MQTSPAVRMRPAPCQRCLARRAVPFTSQRTRTLRINAQKSNIRDESQSEVAPSKLLLQLVAAVAAAQLAFSGTAVADINQPILPGADVTSKDLPDGPKPLDALTWVGLGNVGDKVSDAASKANDKAGSNTFDVKSAAEKAVKKSPLGFMNIGELAFDLPGSGVSKDDLPNNVKPGDAAGLPKGPTAKPPSLPSLPKLPGADAGKPDVKGAAEKAVKKSPLGFLNVGELAFDLPGSGVSKDDLPNNVKPGDAAGLPKGPTAKPPSLPNLPKLPGADAGKPDVKGAAEKAVKKSPLGFMNISELAFDLPGSGVSKDDLPNNVKPGDAAGLPKGPTAKPPSLPNLPKLPGADAGKPDVKGAADKAVKKSPLGFMNVSELAFDLPGSGVSKDDLPNNVKPGDAAGLPKGPTAKPPSLPNLPKLPGADAGKPDVKGAAKKAAKKSPLGFMNIGELAFDLPGSGVSKDDLPNNVKPGDAAGLPKGPTAKPPSLPSLPKLPGADAGKPDVKGAAEKAVKKSPLGFMNLGELAFDLPGSGVSKDDLPNNVKPGDAAGLPKGPTAKPPSLPNLPKLPGADAGKPDVKGAAEKAIKKSPLGFMNIGELAFDLPGSGVSKDDLPNNVKPGDAAGLPKGPTAKPPSLPSLPKLPGADAGKPDVKGAAEKAVKKSPLGFMNVGELAFDLPGSGVSKDDLPNNVKPGDAAGLPKGPTAKPPSLPNLPKLPGADAGKPDVKGAADKAVKKSPLGFMNVGELAFDLPGSGVSKDDLPNNVKPGDAAGLPKGPTAKPPSLPNLPKLPGADAGKPDVKGAANKAVKKSPLGFMNIGELAFDLPGSGVSKDDLPNNVKPGDAAGLPKGPTAKPPSLPKLPKLPGADAGKPDVKGAADEAVKKSPLGFMNLGELAFDLPGSGVSKDDLPNNVKPGDAAGLPKGPTAKPPSLPNLPKLPGADAGKPDVKGAAEKAVKKSPLGFMNIGELAFDLNLPGSNVKKTDLPNGPKPFDAGEVATPNLPSTDDLPSLPGNPTDQVKDSLSQVGLPDLSGGQSKADDVASKAQTAASGISGAADVASKAGDAKDSLQEAANSAGLE
ncbi:hypothetical protein WJX79_010904 [Trebouxia sp. C0005]